MGEEYVWEMSEALDSLNKKMRQQWKNIETELMKFEWNEKEVNDADENKK